MLDSLIAQLTEEVAVDGYQGTSIDNVWLLVERFATQLTNEIGLATAPLIDLNYKRYVWRFLRQVSQLEFHEDTDPMKVEPGNDAPDACDTDDATFFADDNDANDSDDASMPGPSLKRNCRRIIGIATLAYDEVERIYGSRLRLIASPELQTKQLLFGVPPGRSFSKTQKTVLLLILQARTKGIFQSQLTEDLSLDPRSTGHYVKTLEKKGAITRTKVCVARIQTNLCVHARFSRNDQGENLQPSNEANATPYNVNARGVAFSKEMLCEKMIELVSEAKDHVMVAHDILNALGFDATRHYVRKWFHRSVNEMCLAGYFRKLSTTFDGRRYRCLELLNPDSGSLKDKQDTCIKQLDPDFPILRNQKMLDSQIKPMLLGDMTLEYQVLQVLRTAGTHGITRNEIGAVLGCNESRMLHKVLERMVGLVGPGVEKYGARSLLEFEGRNRRYRYYTYAAYMKVHESTDIEEKEVATFHYEPSDIEHLDFRVIPESTVPPARKRGRPRKTPRPEDIDNTDASNQVPKGARKATKKQKEQPTGNTTLPSSETIPEAASSTPAAGPSTITSRRLAPIFEQNTAEAVSRSPEQLPAQPTAAVEENQTTFMEADLAGKGVATSVTPTKRTRGKGLKSTAKATPLPLAGTLVEDTSPQTNTDTSEPPAKRPRGRPPGSKTKKTPTRRSLRTANTENVSEGTADTNAHLQEQPGPEVSMASATSPTADLLVISASAAMEPQPMEGKKRSVIEDYFYKAPMETRRAAKKSRMIGAMSPDTVAEVTSQSVSAKDSAHLPETMVASEATEKEKDAEASVDSQNNLGDEGISGASEEGAESLDVKEEPGSVSQDTKKKEPAAKKTRVRQRKTPTASINVYMEQRKKVMLAMLEETPIIDHGRDMKRHYEKKRAEVIGPDRADHVVCIKTLRRTSEVLAAEGLAQVKHIDYTLLNGQTTTKMLIVRKDIPLDGPELAQFVSQMYDRKTLQPRFVAFPKIEKVGAPVERLDERLQRMEEDRDLSIDNKHVTRAGQLHHRIRAIKANLEKVMSRKEAPEKVMGGRLMLAIQFGYISSKMIRAKILHQYMYGYVYNGSDALKDDGVIPGARLITDMQLATYFQVIGMFHPNQAICDYVRDSEHFHVRAGDTPEEIRALLFGDMNRFRRRLRIPLDILEGLGLVRRTDMKHPHSLDRPLPKSPSNLAASYKLITQIDMINYRLVDCPVVRSYQLQSPTDVQIYWSDLQYLSTAADSANDDLGRTPASETEDMLLKSLFTPKNWSTSFVYNKEQRRLLNSYVNRAGGFTPINDARLCKAIADESSMTLSMVRNYYQKLEKSFERKAEQREIEKIRYSTKSPRRPRRRRGTLKSGEAHPSRSGKDPSQSKIISLTTTKAFQRQRPWTTARRLASQEAASSASSSARPIEDRPFLDNQDVPLLDDANLQSKLAVRQMKRRSTWTNQEDEVMLYMYVILQPRQSTRQFLWKPMSLVLPERKAPQARKRFDRLKQIPQFAEQLSMLTTKWQRLYKEGIASGEIQDPNPEQLDSVDLLSHLAYFIQRLQMEPSDMSVTKQRDKLPATMDEIYHKYNVEHMAINGPNYYFEDEFFRMSSLVQRHQAMCNESFSLRIPRTIENDVLPSEALPELDSQKRTVELLKMYFKMILLTPAETYDPFYAYAILNQFPQDAVTLASEQAKEEGALVYAKAARDLQRRLPGTNLGISERFLNHMAGRLPPDLFMQAREYEKHLRQNRRVSFMPVDVSSGMMACILDLLSENKIKLHIRNRSLELAKHMAPQHKSRMLDEKLSSFQLEMEMTETQAPLELPPKAMIEDRKLRPLPVAEFEVVLTGLLQSQPDSGRKLLRCIVDALAVAGNKGATLHEIKDAVQKQGTVFEDVAMDHCLAALIHSVPPLIARVGFWSPRLVLTTELQKWVITGVVSRPQFQAEMNTSLTHKEAVEPRLWIDVNGAETPSVLKGCLEAVLEVIMERPGITEASVCRHFAKRMVRVEITELLDKLIARHAVRRLLVTRNTDRVTLFSKPVCFRASPPTAIEPIQQTCYWPLAGAYNTL